MATQITGQYLLTNDLARRLDEKRPLLKDIGLFLVGESQAAFTRKGLGEHKWATRYPGQANPFLNIAGALSDLNRGSFVRDRRFDREPVLQDTGQLFRSIGSRVVAQDTVEVGVGSGPATAYAGLHQKGGTSRQEVTQTARDTLSRQMKQLRRGRRAPKREKKVRSEEDIYRREVRRERRGVADQRVRALEKLGFIYRTDTLETEINARPFVGITDEAKTRIHDLVVTFFTGKEG